MKILKSETTSRFIVEKSYYRPGDETVKPHAYEPDKQGDCSVFRIKELINENIWTLGEKFVGKLRGKPIKGRSDIKAEIIFESGLKLIPEIKTHQRHSNITGYPSNPDELLEVTTELANNAKLVLK